MILFFVAAVALGCLQHCDAELPAVGNCNFMEYYCTLREYESHFFKKLYKDPGADCGLQFWNMYYLSLKKSETCLSNLKKLEVANIKEIQLLYCSGLDLEAPLMFSLSPCSDKHKRKVNQCINDFATTFSNDKSNPSLCRKRGKAKLCTVVAWQTICNYSEIAEGIYNMVIGDFNPFCSNDKDPWASGTDLCADYRIPYHDPKCNCSTNNDKPTEKRNAAEDNKGLSGGEIAGIVIGSLVFVVVVVIIVVCICRCYDDDCCACY